MGGRAGCRVASCGGRQAAGGRAPRSLRARKRATPIKTDKEPYVHTEGPVGSRYGSCLQKTPALPKLCRDFGRVRSTSRTEPHHEAAPCARRCQHLRWTTTAQYARACAIPATNEPPRNGDLPTLTGRTPTLDPSGCSLRPWPPQSPGPQRDTPPARRCRASFASNLAVVPERAFFGHRTCPSSVDEGRISAEIGRDSVESDRSSVEVVST